MEHPTENKGKKEIEIFEQNGVFMVPAELEDNFVYVPDPKGKTSLVFWDEGCLNIFLENYGFIPIIVHKS